MVRFIFIANPTGLEKVVRSRFELLYNLHTLSEMKVTPIVGLPKVSFCWNSSTMSDLVDAF